MQESLWLKISIKTLLNSDFSEVQDTDLLTYFICCITELTSMCFFSTIILCQGWIWLGCNWLEKERKLLSHNLEKDSFGRSLTSNWKCKVHKLRWSNVFEDRNRKLFVFSPFVSHWGLPDLSELILPSPLINIAKASSLFAIIFKPLIASCWFKNRTCWFFWWEHKLGNHSYSRRWYQLLIPRTE